MAGRAKGRARSFRGQEGFQRGGRETSELSLGSNPAFDSSKLVRPGKSIAPFCVIEILYLPHRIGADVGLPKSSGFFACGHLYQMTDTIFVDRGMRGR